MGGHVLESWKEEMMRIDRAEGRIVLLSSLIKQGIITLEKAAEEAGLTVEEFESLCRKKCL